MIESMARAARGLLKINGLFVEFISIDVTNKNYYYSDTFDIEIALNSAKNISQGINLNFWASIKNSDVEIFLGFPTNPSSYTSSDLDSVFVGQIDDMDIMLEMGVVRISGRDLSARLIDTKTTERYANLTASEIATMFATEHQLKPVVTPTTTLVGSYLQDYAQVSVQSSEWDILTSLAQYEGFTLYVQGRELHFAPRPTEDQNNYVLKYSFQTALATQKASFKSIVYSRSLTLARDVTVKVQSYNGGTGKTYKSIAKLTKAAPKLKGDNVDGAPQVYTYNIPGLTQEQVTQRAQKLLLEISSQEIRVNVTLPGDNKATKNSVILIQSTGTTLDQPFFVNSITRRFSATEGYGMTINAKNHDTNSTTSLE